MRITEQPLVRYVGEDGRGVALWRLEEPVQYFVGGEATYDVITVPEKFVTDFASTPRLFWSLYPPTGSYLSATIVHDWLYVTTKRSREEADAIFLEAMEVIGIPYLRRQLFYRLVRMFGGQMFGHRMPVPPTLAEEP